MYYEDTYVTVLLLDEFQEGRHIWPSKVIDSLQAREHGGARQTLKMVLANILQQKKR